MPCHDIEFSCKMKLNGRLCSAHTLGNEVLYTNCNYETFTFANIIFSSIFVCSSEQNVSLPILTANNLTDWNKKRLQKYNSLNFGVYSQSDQCDEEREEKTFVLLFFAFFCPETSFFYFRCPIG